MKHRRGLSINSTHECSLVFSTKPEMNDVSHCCFACIHPLSIISENTLLSISVESSLIFQFLLDSTVSNSYLECMHINLRSFFSFQRELISVLGKVSRKELDLSV